MDTKTKAYKRLSEIDAEEREIITQVLREVNDAKLVATEFNIFIGDLEEFLQDTNKKAEQPANEEVQMHQLSSMQDTRKEVQQNQEQSKKTQTQQDTKVRMQQQEKARRLQTKQEESQQPQSAELPSNDRKFAKKKNDYRMQTIRNKYYYFYKRKDSNMPKVLPKAMTDKDQKELNTLIETFKRGILSSKEMRKLDEKIGLVEDIDKLQEIYKILQSGKGKYDFRIESMKTSLSSRISKLRLQKSVGSMVNDVSDSIKDIILGIVSGNIDIEDAKEKIQIEVQRKLGDGSKNSRAFAMTEEQARKQIFMQIRRVLVDRANEFRLEEPVKAVNVLNELTGKDELYLNVSAVANNLSARRKYGIAKAVCDNYSSLKIPYIDSLRREIIGREIGEIVLAQIRKSATPEEDTEFMNLLEERLRRTSTKKQLINLGTSEDGGRKITLADVWYDNRVR